ncbi:MAG: MBL fold metallo-hydrolase [Rhizomicrobium sp.]
MKATVIPVTPYRQNCSLLWCTKTNRGAIVDPGGEVAKLKEVILSQGVTLEKVLLTHGHLDHASGAAQMARDFGVPIEGPHEDDRFLLEGLAAHARNPAFAHAENCMPDRWLKDGDEVQVGEVILGVRHCPGHTPGHVVLFNSENRIAFVGDVLFAGSVGRSDLPRGSHEQLVKSITERLWPLGDDMRFVPGHGQMSTFGWERKTNPYVSELALGR